MPWLVNMRRLDRYNIMNTYDRWAEEIQALLAISGVSKAITEKGGEGDDTARSIIMLSLERDLRDFMSGKINASSAVDLWNGIKKAKKVLVSLALFDNAYLLLRFIGLGGGVGRIRHIRRTRLTISLHVYDTYRRMKRRPPLLDLLELISAMTLQA